MNEVLKELINLGERKNLSVAKFEEGENGDIAVKFEIHFEVGVKE